MSPRTARWVAAAIVVAAVGCTISALVLSFANGIASLELAGLVIGGLGFALVGAFIVLRRRDHPLGWILAAAGLLQTTGWFAEQFAVLAFVTRPGSLPGGVVAVWYGEWFWIPWIFLQFVFGPLVFPTGRLTSKLWRPFALVACVGFTIMASLERELALANEGITIRNPVGVLPLDDVEDGALAAFLFGPFMLCTAAALASVVVRYRRSRGEERAQLKWFTYAIVLLIGGFLLSQVLQPLLGRRPFLDLLFIASLSLIPVSIGVSILRYRLYDIDRIISRTFGLRRAHSPPRSRLRCRHGHASVVVERRDASVAACRGRLDACRGSGVPPGALPHPGFHRPPLQPAEI
jgi:uncharacterized membrane protein YidH (DUF202 family)